MDSLPLQKPSTHRRPPHLAQAPADSGDGSRRREDNRHHRATIRQLIGRHQVQRSQRKSRSDGVPLLTVPRSVSAASIRPPGTWSLPARPGPCNRTVLGRLRPRPHAMLRMQPSVGRWCSADSPTAPLDLRGVEAFSSCFAHWRPVGDFVRGGSTGENSGYWGGPTSKWSHTAGGRRSVMDSSPE